MTSKSVHLSSVAQLSVPFSNPRLACGKKKSTPEVSLGKRQLSQFPNFSCAVVSLEDDAVFAGRENGAVVSWKMPTTHAHVASRSAAHTLHTVVGEHKGGVTCMAFSASTKLLISASCDCCIKVWDALGMYSRADNASGRCVQTIPAHDATICVLATHLNLVISGSTDRTLKVWRFDDNREGLALPWLVAKQAFVFDSWVTALWTAPVQGGSDVQHDDIYAGDAQGNVILLRCISAPLLTASDNGTSQTIASHLELVRLANPQQQSNSSSTSSAPNSEKATAHKGPPGINRLLPVSSCNMLVTLGYDSCAVIWDLVQGTIMSQVRHPEATTHGATPHRFLDVVYFAEREDLLLLDNKCRLYVWSTRSNAYLCDIKLPLGASALVQHPTPVVDLEGLWVVHREGVELVKVHRTVTVVEIHQHTGRVLSIAATPEQANSAPDTDGVGDEQETAVAMEHQQLHEVAFASASVDSTLCLWNSRLQCVRSFKETTSEISAFALLSEYDLCVTGHDNGSIKTWALSSDRQFRFAAHDNTVSAVCKGLHKFDRGQFVPWTHLFTVSYDGCLAVWDIASDGTAARCEARVRVSNSELLCAAYDSIKCLYIVGGNNGSVTLWSVDELKPVVAFRHQASPIATQPRGNTHMRHAHREAVTCVILDGNIAFTGGEDKKLFMWNTLTGECANEFETDGILLEDGSLCEVGEIQHMCLMPETGDVFVTTRSGRILVFSQSTRKAEFTYCADKEVSCVCWNRASQEVLVGLDDGRVLKIHRSMLRPLSHVAAAPSS